MAGEAIYAALFDAAPSLQSLFKTARQVFTCTAGDAIQDRLNTV